jgi:LEA14-like dessication related protein
MKKLFAPLLLALATLFAAGCSSNMQIVTAGLRPELLRLQRLPSGDVQVTWRVSNPNVVPYVITRSILKVSIDGKPVGELSDPRRFAVPAQNLAEQVSVLSASAITNVATVEQALVRGNAGYSVNATIWILMLEDKEEKFRVDASGSVATGAP